MKKFLISVMCAAVSVASLFGLSACGGGKSGQTVNLVSVTAAEVGVRGDVDYFVVPEPAASVKVGAMKNLVFSGDVQKLYGGEEGYPQAVVVVKNNIAANSLIGALVSELKTSEDWLLSEEVSSSTICNAVASHLTKGMTPTFTEKNLDKSVIENCSVKFTDARNCKQKVKAFMEKINAVGQSAFGMPQDKFFSEESNFENTEHVGSVSVYAPDGAPALGLAKLMAETSVLNGTDMNYGIVDQKQISVGKRAEHFIFFPVTQKLYRQIYGQHANIGARLRTRYIGLDCRRVNNTVIHIGPVQNRRFRHKFGKNSFDVACLDNILLFRKKRLYYSVLFRNGQKLFSLFCGKRFLDSLLHDGVANVCGVCGFVCGGGVVCGFVCVF